MARLRWVDGSYSNLYLALEKLYKESRDHFDFTVAALKGWI
jgi:hypothetical protein